MELQLILNGVDMTQYLIQPGGKNEDSGYHWRVQRNCFKEDSMYFALDFGRHVSPDNFRMAEVWFQSAHPSLANLGTVEHPYYLSRLWATGGYYWDTQETIWGIPETSRPTRLFGGIINYADYADQGQDERPYPVLEFEASGYNWRFLKTILYSNPDTTMWVFETDVDMILHPRHSQDRADVPVYTPDLEGFAPPIIDWYRWRPIRSLASPGTVQDLKDGGIGNLDMISRNTKVGMKYGWNAVGGPTKGNLPDNQGISHEHSGIPYLPGFKAGVVHPTPQPAAKVVNDLSLRTGSVWWVSPYGELNYTRPQDWGAYTITRQHSPRRVIDLHRLSTITALLNLSLFEQSAEPYTIEYEDGENIAMPTARQAVVGVNTNVLRTRLGQSSVQVPLYQGVAPEIHPRPVTMGPVYYNLSTNTLTVSDSFMPGEQVTFHEGMTRVLAPPISLLLAHDPRIQPNSGLFIEPVHANLAATPWDAFNKVAETLHDGADLERVECYHTDDTWAHLLGKAVNFDSPFLNIEFGKATQGGRASTVAIQDINDHFTGRSGIGSIPLVDTSIDGQDYVEYVLNYVVNNIRIESREDLLGVYDDVLGDVLGDPVAPGIQPRRRVEPFVQQTGYFKHDLLYLKARSLVRHRISREEYERRREEAVQYLQDERRVWVGKNSTYSMRVNFDDAFINEVFASEPDISEQSLAMAVWHQLDHQTVVDFDLLNDQELREEIRRFDPDAIPNLEEFSRYFAAYGRGRDDEGYYCRNLSITPEGPALQRYDAQFFRFPPLTQEGIDDALDRWKQIQDEVEKETRIIIPVALPEKVEQREAIQTKITEVEESLREQGLTLPPFHLLYNY